MPEFKCKKCGYEWRSRKTFPKACPNCKRYDWLVSTQEKQTIIVDKEKFDAKTVMRNTLKKTL